MEKRYTTSQVAQIIGIHPNTVRLYEELKLITKPDRGANGYRIFTDLHIDQFRVARLSFQVEVLQNGLRKQAAEIAKASAACEFERALALTAAYLKQIEQEKYHAEEAIRITERILKKSKGEQENLQMTRKETADYLQVTIDTLRNWEMNGLLRVKRKQNGYRVYNDADVRQLKIIRALRCANYSLAAILRMLNTLNQNPRIDIREAIDTSEAKEDIITACDNLLTSLGQAEKNAEEICMQLEKMKKEYF